MIYEIVNPSDAYTMRADSQKVAVAAVLMLGEGMYGLRDENNLSIAPLLMLSTPDQTVDALQTAGIYPLETFVDTHREEVAGALESVLIGNREDRERMEPVFASIVDPQDRHKAFCIWHDQRRSSMNDIGQRAWALAKMMRHAAEDT